MHINKSICIVIPCYNEEKRLDTSLFKQYSNEQPNVHFLFVNDGSKDRTLSILKTLESSSISLLDLPHNSGKACAVQAGMLRALTVHNFDYIGYLDADLATPLSEIELFSSVMDQGYFCIFGSRVLRIGGAIERKRSRHYLGRVFATFASISLKLPIYDTQCGAKFFKADLVKDIFTDDLIANWLFDVEIFFRLKRKLGRNSFLENIYELPLRKWKDIHGSQLKTIDFLKAPLELLKIYLKYK